MEDQESPLETLLEKTAHYAKANGELIKLKVVDKSAEMTSVLLAYLAMVLLAALFFLILSFGIAFWIGEMLGRLYYGFFILAGFYAISGVVIYVFREEWIRTPVRNFIVTHALK